MRAISKHN